MKVRGLRLSDPPNGPHVYCWIIDAIPRYYGKATGNRRCKEHAYGGSAYFARRLGEAFERGAQVELEFATCPAEQDAFDYEKALIIYHGREGIDFASEQYDLFGNRIGRTTDGILYNRIIGGGADVATGQKAKSIVAAKRAAKAVA